MLKIMAICETHFVGIIPHFTGPIATAALVNTLGTFSGPVLMEYNFQGRTLPHLPVCLDFKEGKLYPNDRPGLGVERRLQTAETSCGSDGARDRASPDLLPPRRLHHQLVKRMTITKTSVCAALLALSSLAQAQTFRPPAVPLITHDPYFSIWSMADHLNDEPTKHWTGKNSSITGYIRIDGKPYQVIGREHPNTATLKQTQLEVLPTRTIYDFNGAGIKLNLTFLTPALPDDLDILSRPLTYIDWTVSSADGKPHSVQVYFEASNELVVNTPDQPVVVSRSLIDGEPVLRIGSKDQPVLGKRGDDLRIDWGYLYLMSDRHEGLTSQAALHADTLAAFLASGKTGDSDDLADRMPPRRGLGGAIAMALDLGNVTTPVSRYLMLAYDDIYSVEYFQRPERAWWRRNGAEASDLLRGARHDHDSLLARSRAFDEELMADLRKAGGEHYARLAALAYRQTIAAHKLVADIDGRAMFFPKENFSNGCIATVDVIYPSAPFTLLFSPALIKAQLNPVLEYASMSRWRGPSPRTISVLILGPTVKSTAAVSAPKKIKCRWKRAAIC